MKVYKLKEDLDKESQLTIKHDVLIGCDPTAVNVIIPDDVAIIGDEAFKDCTTLKSVIIPNSVTEIGIDAFSGCTSLKSITIPNSVTLIDSRAFQDCLSLKSVTIQGNANNITLESYIFGDRNPDLVVNTNNRIVINYCKQNNINYRRITSLGKSTSKPKIMVTGAWGGSYVGGGEYEGGQYYFKPFEVEDTDDETLFDGLAENISDPEDAATLDYVDKLIVYTSVGDFTIRDY